LLPNGNTLICAGRTGYIVELNMAGEIVWEYKTPLIAGQAATQGDMLALNNNLTFRAFKYPADYSAFDNRDLSSKGFIELEPDIDFCDELVSIATIQEMETSIYPNPTNGLLHFTWDSGEMIDIKLIDILGRTLLTTRGNGGMHFMDLSQLRPDLYFIIVDNVVVEKVIVNY